MTAPSPSSPPSSTSTTTVADRPPTGIPPAVRRWLVAYLLVTLADIAVTGISLRLGARYDAEALVVALPFGVGAGSFAVGALTELGAFVLCVAFVLGMRSQVTSWGMDSERAAVWMLRVLCAVIAILLIAHGLAIPR